MPHQRLIADVACEIDPDTGLPAYREVVVTVPRQSGKTTLFLTWQIHRCVSPRWSQPQRSVFTAQSGKDARDKWLDELFPLIRGSRDIRALVESRGDRLAINEGMGNESIRWRTGSLIRLLSTSSSSGHSKTIHQAVLDEVWHDVDSRREQGLRPAMITVPDAQLLVCSTAGTDMSVVLNRKVERGRAAVERDSGRGVAYFEWSAPDDWDPEDEESYLGFMPALCPSPPCRCGAGDGGWRHTVTLDVIRGERESMELVEFARAYGNRKAGSAEQLRVIDPGLWESLASHGEVQRPEDSVFALVVDPERTRASVGFAGRRPDGLLQVGLVDWRPGTQWVADRLLELRDRWDPPAIAVDTRSEATLTELERRGLTVPEDPERPRRGDLAVPSASDTAAAYGLFVDAVRAEGLRHADDAPVNAALGEAQTRPLAGGVTWDHRRGEVGPLKAVTLAVWAYETRAHLVEGDLDEVGVF